jgi:hypothetical protein
LSSNGRDTMLLADGENNSPKSRNVYIGQWDSIKEKKVWAFMEGDGDVLPAERAVKGSLHVDQQKKKLTLNAK